MTSFDEKSKGKWSINLISNAVFHWPNTEDSELPVINLKSHDCKKSSDERVFMLQ